jgi:hypothetical protein
VRVAFVDGLDLAAGSFIHVEPKVTGRPGYAPADLLKLYIYGYMNRVRSSRRLEAETHRNIEVIWLLRRLKPDFKTIADFRRDNRNAFRHVFRGGGVTGMQAFARNCRNRFVATTSSCMRARSPPGSGPRRSAARPSERPAPIPEPSSPRRAGWKPGLRPRSTAWRR